VKINFGKFKGMELSDIPKEDKGINYLKWLVETGKTPSDGSQKSAITSEMINEIEKILNSYNSNTSCSITNKTPIVNSNSVRQVSLKDLTDAIELEIGLVSQDLQEAEESSEDDGVIGTWQGIIEGLKQAKKVIEATWTRTN
jgi:uncharacterized protein (DUF3820 family)